MPYIELNIDSGKIEVSFSKIRQSHTPLPLGQNSPINPKDNSTPIILFGIHRDQVIPHPQLKKKKIGRKIRKSPFSHAKNRS